MLKAAGAGLLFLTFATRLVERFKVACIAGQDGGLAPVVLLFIPSFLGREIFSPADENAKGVSDPEAVYPPRSCF